MSSERNKVRFHRHTGLIGWMKAGLVVRIPLFDVLIFRVALSLAFRENESGSGMREVR